MSGSSSNLDKMIIDSNNSTTLTRPQDGQQSSLSLVPINSGLTMTLNGTEASIVENGICFDLVADLRDGDEVSLTIIVPNVVYDECQRGYNIRPLLVSTDQPAGNVFFLDPNSGLPTPLLVEDGESSAKWERQTKISSGFTVYSLTGYINEATTACISQLFATFSLSTVKISPIYGDNRSKEPNNVSCIPMRIKYNFTQAVPGLPETTSAS